MLRSLNHLVVVRAFAVPEHEYPPHIVLEDLDGPRLSTLLRRYGPLALEQRLPLALESCSVLHYLQGEGVVHLDVKPANVIRGAPPRLIDFSLARTVDDAAGLDERVGTDAYMAPEQYEPGAGGVGPAADMWGLVRASSRPTRATAPSRRTATARENQRRWSAHRRPCGQPVRPGRCRMPSTRPSWRAWTRHRRLGRLQPSWYASWSDLHPAAGTVADVGTATHLHRQLAEFGLAFTSCLDLELKQQLARGAGTEGD